MNALQDINSKIVSSKTLPKIRPGMVVKVHQKIKEGDKTRTQIFEGMVIACKHGSGPAATVTVRKTSNGIGVERIFPLHLPTVEKFEVVKISKVRRAKLYYLRGKTARETRKKTKLINVNENEKIETANDIVSGNVELEK